ncbi:hypothetical protein QFC21_002361 [Naganishia friedmannii]|uniref:Uncharacterized protein n=1 Tax=Naganishia friedmannii TaxID=89922 RepID=A0ACC2VWU2_9TREE|nr:hypothetical protein QFC21_002361 [Naganishia friedmannii]
MASVFCFRTPLTEHSSFISEMSTVNNHALQPGISFPPRPEAHHTKIPPHEASFAILALSGSSQLRALHFPSDVYSQLISTIKQTWPEGIEWATLQSDDGWTCLLRGTPWKKKGTEELESIRLVLGLLQTLSREGWSLLQDVKVGSAKKDVHHFLFRHDELAPASDRFYAVTFPLLDRISLVDPPATSTPGIISSIRSAIVGPEDCLSDIKSCSPIDQGRSHAFRFGMSRSKANRKDGAKGVGEKMKVPEVAPVSQHRCKKIKIKREGWVGTGVYGFDLGGYAVFAGKGIDDFKYNAHQPAILLSLLTDLNRNHSHLVLSLRLHPHKETRRDVLIFMDTNYEPDREGSDGELTLPPRLSFPRAAPPTNVASNHSRNNSTSTRFRPSSLASLNGGPLLPSIPASPSWEEFEDRGSHLLRLPKSREMTTSVNHRKSSSLPGKLNMRRYSPLKMPHLDPIDPTEVLRPSFEDCVMSRELTSRTTRRDEVSAAAPLSLPALPSVENINVKELAAARTVHVLVKSPIEEKIRHSETPEFGVVVLEKDSAIQDTFGTPSDDETAASSPAKPQPLDLPQGSFARPSKSRRGLRNLLKAVF